MGAVWGIMPCSNFAYSLCGTHHLLSSASTEWMVTQKFTFSGSCAGKGEGALWTQIPRVPLKSLGTFSADRGAWGAVQLGTGAFSEQCFSGNM